LLSTTADDVLLLLVKAHKESREMPRQCDSKTKEIYMGVSAGRQLSHCTFSNKEEEEK
jgi:hypothetical protein